MAVAEAQDASTASSEAGAASPGSFRQRERTPWRAVAVRFTPLYLAPALGLYGLFVLWPTVQVCRLALYRWNGYDTPTFIGLSNLSTLWEDPVFRTSLEHTVLWELAGAVIPSLAALAVALPLAQCRGRPFFLSVFLLPALLPATVVAAVWVLVYSPVHGPAGTLLAGMGMGALSRAWLGDPQLALPALFVAWAWSAIGVGVVLFSAGLSAIGREYIELAMVEGAGVLWRFRHVTLPGIRRVGLTALLINAALAAQVFDLIFLTTGGGPGYATMIVPLDMYGRAFGGRTGQGAADACVQIALGLALAAVLLLTVLHRGESLDSGDTRPVRPSGTRPATWLLALCATALMLPLGWLIITALQPGTVLIASHGLDWNPGSWDWGNFPAVWNAGMAGAAETSLLLALGSVVGSLTLAWPAAFALSYLVRGRTRRYAILALLLFGLFQPTPALIIPLFSLLRDLALLGTPWGILLPEIGRTIPFAVLVLWGFMSQSPREILEAAEVDGASPLEQMLWIAGPLARPALYAAAIWAFVTSWNEYLLPTLVSQDGSIVTVPTLLGTFLGKYDTQFGLLAAGSLMAIAPSLTIYLLLRRSAAAGLAPVERSIR